MTMTAERDPLKKPPRGAYNLDRRRRQTARKALEEDINQQVVFRDGRCRWPHCAHMRKARSHWPRLEAAHLTAKGSGGDPRALRSSLEQQITLCFFHHQADRQEAHPDGSLERHDLRIEPLTPQGTSGPCEFWRRASPDGEDWYLVARETAPFIYERD